MNFQAAELAGRVSSARTAISGQPPDGHVTQELLIRFGFLSGWASNQASESKMQADQEQADRENAHEHRRTDPASAPLPDRNAEAGGRQRHHRSAERRQRQGALARERHAERRRRYQERQAERLDEP